MARRENGDVERAGGFLFVWGERDADGHAQGTVWRDNTEQDYQGEPDAYVRESHFTGTLMIKGTPDGYEMGMATLDAAAGFAWGYHTARSDAQPAYEVTAEDLAAATGAIADAREEGER